MNAPTLLDRFLYLGEWGTWKAFWMRSLYIVIGVTVFLEGNALLFSKVFQPSDPYKIPLFVLPYAIFLLTNTGVFLWSRYFGWHIRLSKKTNIVFAYNLNGLYNPERFETKYKTLVSSVQNEIDALGLGNKIKIIIAPSDVRFKEQTAAEAKTLLGLKGSTILVWGHATSNRQGAKFTTRFSYEFGHPKEVGRDKAKVAFNEYIHKVMTSGLFSPIKVDVNNFREQVTPTIILILGLTTFSLQLLDTAERFLNAFKDYYNSQDLMRKRDLGQALVKCEDAVVAIYRFKLREIGVDLDKHLEKSEDLAQRIVAILPRDYACQLVLAYVCETKNDRPGALAHYQIAAANAPSNHHEHLFDSAYFALGNSDFAKAIFEYESIPETTGTDTAAVANFLDKKYSQTNNAIFLFGDGYVTSRWGDRTLGQQSLGKFIQIADPTIHRLLITKARDLLALQRGG